MTELSTLLPRVQPFVTDCPVGVLHDAIRRAASQFARESGCWREELTVDSVQDQSDYNINVLHEHENVNVRRCKRVWYGDAEVFDNLGLWNVSEGVLSFSSAPAASGDEIKVCAVLVGSRLCTEIADVVFDLYGDGIADLALYLVMNVPNRPYTDVKAAQQSYAHYNALLNEAKRVAEGDGERSGDLVNPMQEYF